MISSSDKALLRELAKKQLEYAKLPIMEERKKLWYAHNKLEGKRPMLVMEEMSFENELLEPLQCEGALARELEHTMQRHIVCHEKIDDDKVVPDSLYLSSAIRCREFDIETHLVKPKDSSGVAHLFEHFIKDLETDLHKLKHSTYSYDAKRNKERLEATQDALGDILPIQVKNRSLDWHLIPTFKVVKLMGLENWMMEMALNPDLVRELMQFISDDLHGYLDWLEQENLLTMNNSNDYAGAGSYGFTDELSQNGRITTKDLWCNINSQESSEISPAMYGEFVYPSLKSIADRFGLVYYGCCEPVHAIWEDYLSKIPNLRKVSISAWCNEEYMGEALKGKKTIYSRKPSPNFIGVGKHLDEASFKDYISKTLSAAKNCPLEIIFRDIYTLSGDTSKPKRAIEIIRSML